ERILRKVLLKLSIYDGAAIAFCHDTIVAYDDALNETLVRQHGPIEVVHVRVLPQEILQRPLEDVARTEVADCHRISNAWGRRIQEHGVQWEVLAANLNFHAVKHDLVNLLDDDIRASTAARGGCALRHAAP